MKIVGPVISATERIRNHKVNRSNENNNRDFADLLEWCGGETAKKENEILVEKNRKGGKKAKVKHRGCGRR
ncbi:hypothetical protein RB195_016266 [Necator americanus]|uniref:Uncharacterized protein n=1 Tax=Necator americanus TaxID=51031 RepID=A0ABR1E8C1_NECAM